MRRMGRIVVVAEKPSVGRDIARVLNCGAYGDGCFMNDRYIVTWALGHLVTLLEPDELDIKYKKWSFDTLPILPEEIPLKVIPKTRSQFTKVKKLICDKDTDSLICATDAGREGELIFRYIYEKSGCKKPFTRLWISSMTDEAISEGFRNIRPGSDYDGLYSSAQCRGKADWLVGMNASRAFTLRYGVLLSVGRVQTPTLAILVRRSQEIKDFKPEGYCTLTADFGDYSGIWFSESADPDTHIRERKTADELAEAVRGRTAVVEQAETARKREPPPQLYDLTSLQRDANKLLGFTAEKTLKLAQSLYETHKALTYPRTDSRYLPPDMIPRVMQTMNALPEEYRRFVSGALPDGRLSVTKRTVDETKVTDHHAIIPTAKRVQTDRFSEDERRLYDLVVRRLLAAFYPACEYEATRIITAVEEQRFRTTGKVILLNGWHDVSPSAYTKTSSRKTAANAAEDNPALPPLKPGDTRTVRKTAVKEDVTKPPSQHTDASLLAAMESAGRELDDEELAKQMKGSGIGTPATRAAIIERLLKVGYVQRKGKTLIATEKGVKLIEIMPKEIASPEMTGRWELALHDITDGRQDAVRFMDGIRRMSAFLVDYAKTKSKEATFPAEDRGRKRGGKKQRTPIKQAACPLCGSGLMESPRAYNCEKPSCGCTIWKDCLVEGGGPELTETLLRQLLEKKQLRGSTGTVVIRDGRILFYPSGSDAPGVNRVLIYRRSAP